MQSRMVVQLNLDARPGGVLIPARLDKADPRVSCALEGEEHLGQPDAVREKHDMVLLGVRGGRRDLGGCEDVREDKVAEDEVGAAGDVVQGLCVRRQAVEARQTATTTVKKRLDLPERPVILPRQMRARVLARVPRRTLRLAKELLTEQRRDLQD